MILECPACHARFMVADQLIPAHGRDVKCGKCANQWHVDGPVAGEYTPPAPPRPIPEFIPERTAKLPVKKPWTLPVRPFKAAAPVLAIAWLVLAVMAYFPKWQETGVFSGLYRSFNIEDTSGLVFADMDMERIREESVVRFALSGSIANHADKPRSVPKVRVQLKDRHGEVISMRVYPVNEVVQPGEVYPFRIDDIRTSFAYRTTSIVVDVGNSLELLMR